MGKPSEDLAYVRNALERQRRWACEILPMWFAAFVAFYFISTSLLKDLANLGVITEELNGSLDDGADVLVIFVLFFLIYSTRKKRKETEISRPKPTSAEYWFHLGPVLLMVGGIIYVIVLAKGLEIPGEVMRPFILAQLAFSLMFVGIRMMRPVFWFGFGFALGGIQLFLFPGLTPYPNTIFAVVGTGCLLFGAWQQRKLQTA